MTIFLLSLMAAAGLSGTYTGSLTLNDRDHEGVIVIREANGKLAVSFGPDAAKLSPATNLKVEGDRLTLEVSPPGHGGGPWKCDVVVKDGRLTGTAVMPEEGAVARLTMARTPDIAGTYTGSLMVETPDGEKDMGATVMVARGDGRILITAGPDPSQLLGATNVKLDGAHLTFEVQTPGGGEPWKFDLQVESSRLFGKVQATHGAESRTGKVDLKRQ